MPQKEAVAATLATFQIAISILILLRKNYENAVNIPSGSEYVCADVNP